MSEHQECYPLPVNCNMGKGRIEFADGKLLCTMPPTCVNESWEYKRDLILNSVNNYDRLRKANEELVQLLKEIQPYIGGLSWPGRIQQALQSSGKDE